MKWTKSSDEEDVFKTLNAAQEAHTYIYKAQEALRKISIDRGTRQAEIISDLLNRLDSLNVEVDQLSQDLGLGGE